MSFLQCNFYSCTLMQYVDVTVYLPSIHNGTVFLENMSIEQVHAPRQYKTLYLLHGALDDHTSWTRFTRVEEYAEEQSLALVMPSGYNGWYSNTPVGSRRFFDFIHLELPAWAEANFPLLKGRENRFIAGLSMGGYGAAKGALVLPERYAACGVFSGAVDIAAMSSQGADYSSMTDRGEEASGSTVDLVCSLFGRPVAPGSQDDLFALAEQTAASGKPLPEFFIGCGTEDFLYPAICKFRGHMEGLGFRVTNVDCPGTHEWKVWELLIEQFICHWLPV